MPLLRPIRPYRYGGDHLAELAELISPAVRGEPVDRGSVGDVHALNVRQLVRGDRGDLAGPEEPAFTHAARLLGRWKRTGVFVREPRPSLYCYEQTAADGSRARGVVGLVRLAPLDSDQVRPHEKTRPSGSDQLLAQLRALDTQLSLVTAMVPDESGALAAFLERDTRRAALELVDGKGTMNRLWRVQAPDEQLALIEALRGECAVIADGHHRYEAALRRQAEVHAAKPSRRERPCDYVMMLLRPLSEVPGASAPTQRVLTGLGAAAADLETLVTSPLVELLSEGDALDPMPELSGPHAVALVQRGRVRVFRLRPDAPESAPAVRGLPAVLRSVDAALLDVLILDPLRESLRRDPAASSGSGAPWSHNRVGAEAAAAAALRGDVDAVFLLRPAPASEVLAVAAAGETMPPKSTNFLPKPIKGLLASSLTSF